MTLNPVVAWQIHRTLSVAIGPTIDYSYTKLRQGIGLAAGDELEFKGDGFDYGFSAGLLWQPHPQWSFGASYFSATTINYEGTTRTKTIPALSGAAHTTGEIDFPQFAKAGISYRPTPRWNFEIDADWTDWDVLNTVSFKGTRDIFGSDLQMPFNWKSSWLYEFGASYYFENGYFLSGGYFFSQNSTLDRNFNPIVPDTDLHVGSLGVGYKGQHWTWALSGQVITGPARTISNSQSTSLIGQSANGDYRWFNQAVNVSLGYRF
jgi:long-chain fatty acid transport protein